MRLRFNCTIMITNTMFNHSRTRSSASAGGGGAISLSDESHAVITNSITMWLKNLEELSTWSSAAPCALLIQYLTITLQLMKGELLMPLIHVTLQSMEAFF